MGLLIAGNEQLCSQWCVWGLMRRPMAVQNSSHVILKQEKDIFNIMTRIAAKVNSQLCLLTFFPDYQC